MSSRTEAVSANRRKSRIGFKEECVDRHRQLLNRSSDSVLSMRTRSTTSWSKLSSSFSCASLRPAAISRFEFLLELVELELNLLRRAALLVDADDALLEIDAGLDGAEHLVAGAEDAVEEPELLVEKLVDPLVGGVALVEEVDDDDVELLAVAVAAADALLDALRIPGQVVVDDQIAELKVDALGGGLGGDHDGGFVAEVLDERGAHVGGRRAGDAVGAGVLLQPALIDRLGLCGSVLVPLKSTTLPANSVCLEQV